MILDVQSNLYNKITIEDNFHLCRPLHKLAIDHYSSMAYFPCLSSGYSNFIHFWSQGKASFRRIPTCQLRDRSQRNHLLNLMTTIHPLLHFLPVFLMSIVDIYQQAMSFDYHYLLRPPHPPLLSIIQYSCA